MAVYTVATSQIRPWVTSFIIARQAKAPRLADPGSPGTPANVHKVVRFKRLMRLKGVWSGQKPREALGPLH
jgi:hypothetical protein